MDTKFEHVKNINNALANSPSRSPFMNFLCIDEDFNSKVMEIVKEPYKISTYEIEIYSEDSPQLLGLMYIELGHIGIRKLYYAFK